MFDNKYINGLRNLQKRFVFISRRDNINIMKLWVTALFDYIRYGVTPNEFTTFSFYEKKHVLKRTYYTARWQNKIEAMFNAPQNAPYFNDKSKFNAAFSKYVQRSWIFCPDHNNLEINDFIKSHTDLIVKPTNLSSGHGIHKLDKSKVDVDSLIRDRALLEEICENHHQLKILAPSALSTVRIYTLLDKNSNVHILGSFLRMGGKKNAIVDNFHSGGVYVRIDFESGIILTNGKNIDGEIFERHPLSGVRFIGFQLPLWEKVKKTLYDIVGFFPDSCFIGWDIAILENRVELIEGNYIADPGFMQSLDNGGKLFDLLKSY